MTKSLMLSIRPEHLVNILNGYKKLELRKTVPKDYKGWVYCYCTKNKPYLGKNHDGNIGLYNIPAFGHFNKGGDLNSKVVARFWFDEYTKIDNDVLVTIANETEWSSEETDTNELLKNACISIYDALEYSKGKDLYAWHIKKLEIFDEPLELSDFIVGLNYLGDIIPPTYKRLKKAPQSYQYVYTKELENEKENENYS